MKNISCFLLFVFFIIFTTPLAAQEGEPIETAEDEKTNETIQRGKRSSKFLNRLLFGGNIGGSFGNNSSSFIINPEIGYRVNDNLITGFGLFYVYAKYNNRNVNNTNIDYKYNLIGGDIFSYYEVVNRLFANARFELFHWDSDPPGNNDEWIPALYLGLGYGISIGRGFIQIGFEYDVLYDEDNSPYSSRIRIPSIIIMF